MQLFTKKKVIRISETQLKTLQKMKSYNVISKRTGKMINKTFVKDK